MNKAKFNTKRNDTNPANPTQNMPRVTKLINKITIQKSTATNCGIQKNNEFMIEIILVGLEEAKYQV
jgi:hypothetical protein